MGVAAENEVDVLGIELGGSLLGWVVDQRDDNIGLARVLDLLGLFVDLCRGVLDVQALDVGRVRLRHREVGGGADQRDLHAVLFHDRVRLHLAGAVLLEDVRAELLVVGARNDAVDQVLVALIKLVVAHSGTVGTDGVDEIHRVLVVGNRRDERGAALVVAGVGDNGVRVVGADVVDDAGDVGGTHFLVALIGLESAVEVGDVGDVDRHLVRFSGGDDRGCGENNRGRSSGGDQRTSATDIEHERLLGDSGMMSPPYNPP